MLSAEDEKSISGVDLGKMQRRSFGAPIQCDNTAHNSALDYVGMTVLQRAQRVGILGRTGVEGHIQPLRGKEATGDRNIYRRVENRPEGFQQS